MRQRRTFSLGSGRQQDGPHAGSQPGADRSHVRTDQLHRIVDSQTGRHRSSGRVDINLNVFVRLGRFEKQQLRLDDIGHVVINGATQKNDPIHHQPRKDIHRGHVHLPLLDDRRGDGALRRRFELMQFKTADPGMTGRIFFKLALTHNYFILPLLSFIESLSGISLQTPNQKAIRPEFSGLPLNVPARRPKRSPGDRTGRKA